MRRANRAGLRGLGLSASVGAGSVVSVGERLAEGFDGLVAGDGVDVGVDRSGLGKAVSGASPCRLRLWLERAPS